MSKANVCPLCNEGVLESVQVQEPLTYKGKTKLLPVRYSLCACCGSEIGSQADLRENKRIANDFKKHVDGLLTGSQLRSKRCDVLGISQQEAAEIFGGGPKAFSKYESDDVIQSEAMDKLIRLASAIPEAMQLLREISGVAVNVESSVVVSSTQVKWSEVSSDFCEETTQSVSDRDLNQVSSSVKSWSIKKVA
ncbi:TPA: type II toxin-antitoxin system MqsA family antitoxin [Serratia marcescens]